MPLEISYNYSLSLGVVPDSLKIAQVIPVYNTGSQFLLTNCRPISLLSVFNEILQRLINNNNNNNRPF